MCTDLESSERDVCVQIWKAQNVVMCTDLESSTHGVCVTDLEWCNYMRAFGITL